MNLDKFITKIKKYSFFSFILPLITINSCMLLFSMLGSYETYPDLAKYNYYYQDEETEYPVDNFLLVSDLAYGDTIRKIKKNTINTFTNCPRYQKKYNFVNYNNEILQSIETDSYKIDDELNYYDKDGNLIKTTGKQGEFNYLIELKKSKIKAIKVIPSSINNTCVKNNKFIYFILRNFSFLENILIISKQKNTSGFSKISNPYIYGEVSISRTARFFPSNLIFKPFVILSAIFLILYWKNNLNVFENLKKSSVLESYSKKFFYLGLTSATFLILHALFLGIDLNSDWFDKFKRLILIFFIFFEVLAQFFLTINLYKFKIFLKDHIKYLIIKLKIIFVILISFVTIIITLMLSFGAIDDQIKHVLEWNYFSVLLLYYLLSRFLWK